MGIQTYDEGSAYIFSAVWDDTKATTEQDFLSGTNGPARIDAILCVNTDTIDHLVEFAYEVQGAGYGIPFGTATIPAGAGDGTTATYDAVPDLTVTALPAILLTPGTNIRTTLKVAINTDKALCFTLVGGKL